MIVFKQSDMGEMMLPSREKDFVKVVKCYLDSSVCKVMAIIGLRGTGKTTGILQAAEGYDITDLEVEKVYIVDSGEGYANIGSFG